MYSTRHLGQCQVDNSAALSAERESRVAARAAAKSQAWRAQLWMQKRWKTAKQSEEQDQVGSEILMRSRHIKHDRAPEDDELRNDWIFERSAMEGEDWPVDSK